MAVHAEPDKQLLFWMLTGDQTIPRSKAQKSFGQVNGMSVKLVLLYFKRKLKNEMELMWMTTPKSFLVEHR